LQLSDGDRCLNVMPLFHIHGLVGALLCSMVAGTEVVCAAGFDAEKFFGWLEHYRPTWYTAVPTIHQEMLSRAKTSPEIIERHSLRLIRSCSAPLPAAIAQELEDVFRVPVIEAYGMTEAAHQIASNPLPPKERKVGSVGLPAGTEIAIMNGEGGILSPGEKGEILIRGPFVIATYASALTDNDNFTDGWFRTGDQGYFDADGYLFLTGRLKEIINRGGEKISPREVEEVLAKHPAVAEAVTFAVPHRTLGEDVAAAVVAREKGAVTESEIRRFVAAQLADFKVPRQIVFVDEIPKGATGKLQRLGLAEKLGLTGPDTERQKTLVGPRDKMELRLTRIWQDILGLKSVGVEDNFFELGGNSLIALRVLTRVEKEFNRVVPLATLFAAPTVAKLADLLRDGGKELKWKWLVPFQRVGSKPPLFLAHASGELGRQINTDQPVYGLRPHGLDGRRLPSSVEQMAADYLEEIRMIQPNGVYFVGGFSFGGLVAFEVAQQLREQGQEVALLVLLDPTSPNYEKREYAASSSSSQAGVTRFGRLWVRQMIANAEEKIRDRVYSFKMLVCRALLALGRRVPVGLRVFYYVEMNSRAASNYVARVYPGRVVLSLTKRATENDLSNWLRLVPELEVYDMPGKHLDVIQGPLVKTWAERVRTCLQPPVQSETGRADA
jgi:oxalate---CoA ligase